MALARAKEFLSGAELALAQGLFNVCASCCYYALFWAAIAALTREGFKREEWSHGGLKQEFTLQLIKKRGLYPEEFGTWLTDGYNLRREAHYKQQGAPVKKTRRMLEHASRFVMKVEEVIRR